jgi:D-alanyl-D-alanine carboxypeptidase/D-alanyl-D-alanine-endopeptidase (penicillin-binding protein 4)
MGTWKRRLGLAAFAAPLGLAASIGLTPADPQPKPAADPTVARADWLKRAIDAELAARAPLLGAARVGVAVVDLATGKPLYAHDGDGVYNLASNTKVLTATAALAALGPGFTWRTGVYAADLDPATGAVGDLYVRGRGNPSLGTEDLDALAADLAAAGVTKVARLVLDGSYFDAVDEPPHFAEQPLEQAYFRAPIAATSLNFDAVKLTVRPSPTGTGAAGVVLEPRSDYVVALGSVATVASGRSRVAVATAVERGRLVLTLSGQIRADDRPAIIRRRVPDPAAYFAAVLRARLAAHGVKVASKAPRKAVVPIGAVLLAEHESASLAVVARDLGKHSNNYVAEMLLKTLGAEVVARGARPATWEDGLTALRQHLSTVVGLRGDFYVGNGSGLFAASRFTPRQMTEVLTAGYRDFRYGPDLVASLSIAGVDGTLGHRMAEGPAARRIRAKTGSLAGVSALSGFVATGGPPLAFAILINGAAPEAKAATKALEDAVCEAMVRYLELAPGAPPLTPAPRAAPVRADAAPTAENG